MSFELTEQQFRYVSHLTADQRYDYFVSTVSDWQQVWSLHGKGGWVVVSSTDGEECFPVWPHPDYAAAWATGDWADCRPEAIPLDVWLERWTPGMEQDGTLLAVFPNEEEEGVVVSPGELRDSLLEELGC